MSGNTKEQFKSPQKAEILAAFSEADKARVSEISRDTEFEITYFQDVLEALSAKEAQELDSIFTQADKIYGELMSAIEEVEQDYGPLTPVSEIKKQLEKLEGLHSLFLLTKAELVKELKDMGYEEKGPVSATSEVQQPAEAVRLEVKSTSVESENNKEYIESLVEGYKALDKGVFLAEDKRYKDVDIIVKEIELVCKYEGFEIEQINHFFNEIKNSLNALNLAEDDFDHAVHPNRQDVRAQNEANAAAKEYFNELIQSVHAFLETKKNNNESTESRKDSKEEILDVDEQISAISNEYQTLLEEITQTDFDTNTSDTIKALDKVLDGLFKNDNEKDAAVAKNNKEKYLKVFRKNLDKLKNEVADFYANNLKGENSKDSQESVASEGGEGEYKYRIKSDTLEGDIFSEYKLNTAQVDPIEPNLTASAAASPEGPIDPVVAFASASPLPPAPEVTSLESVGLRNRSEHWEIKKIFKQKESEYKSAMEAFYQDKSLASRARHTVYGVGKLFGMKPVLSTEMQERQREYKETRQLYAASLDRVLAERALGTDSNSGGYKEYDSNSDAVKIAFGTKFILKPSEAMLRLQAREIMSPENKARLTRVMDLMKNNKKTVRAMMIVGAGVFAATAAAAAGAATVGVAAAGGAGAGIKATRIVASAFVGGAAALGAKELTQEGVNKARSNFELAKSSATSQFTLNDLNKLEELLQATEFEKSRAENKQKAAVIGAAVLAGGATAATIPEVDSFDYTGVPDNAPEALLNNMEVQESGSAEAVTPSATELPRTADPTPFADNNTQVEGSNFTLEQSQTLTEAPAIPSYTMERYLVNHYGPSGSVESVTVLHDMKVEGSNLDGLTEANKAELNRYIQLTAGDLLSPQPNMSEPNLERLLLEKVNTKFGGTTWFAESEISKIDIGRMEPRPLGISETPIEGGIEITVDDVGHSYTEAAPVENIPSEYVIQKGDTLWDLTQENFKTKLSGLTPIERNEVIDSVMDKIQADPELMKSIGIRGDVDEIFTGENVNMEVLQNEIDKAVEKKNILDSFRKSAPIMVESDAGAKDVPIAFKVNTAPEVPEVVESVRSIEPPVEVKPEVVPVRDAVPTFVAEPRLVPKISPLNGEYFGHPEYEKFIEKNYGSVDKFEATVRKAVKNFDDDTYDFFQRRVANYESPYSLLSEIKLRDLEDYEKPENLAEVKALLQKENMKYETYLAWMDLVKELKTKLPNTGMTTVSDLFSRYIAEAPFPKPNLLTS